MTVLPTGLPGHIKILLPISHNSPTCPLLLLALVCFFITITKYVKLGYFMNKKVCLPHSSGGSRACIWWWPSCWQTPVVVYSTTGQETAWGHAYLFYSLSSYKGTSIQSWEPHPEDLIQSHSLAQRPTSKLLPHSGDRIPTLQLLGKPDPNCSTILFHPRTIFIVPRNVAMDVPWSI
jgi:hypothetical protein